MRPAQEPLGLHLTPAPTPHPLPRQLGLQSGLVWGHGSGLDSIGGQSQGHASGQRPRDLSMGMPVNWKFLPVTSPADTAGEGPHPVPAPCSDSGRHRYQAVTAFRRKDAGGGRGMLSSRLSGKPLLFFLSLPGSWPQLALTSTCERYVLCAC